MTIDTLSGAPDRAGRYRVVFSDGTVLRLYRQTVEDFGLFPGMELSPAELARLKEAASKMSAKMRAVRIVSQTSISKGELERRLIQKGEGPAQAREAVDWMGEMELLDDARTAQQIVAHCISRGYGQSRARQALYEKRIPREYWDEALRDYPAQEEALLVLLRRRIDDPADHRQVSRAIDAAMRRGHRYSDVRKALEKLSVDADEIPEE
ncbi:MAG: recombination regulator RecX [Firmicutes bacterium]|nr:recombination regulator RecX [Bacillota bacterium]